MGLLRSFCNRICPYKNGLIYFCVFLATLIIAAKFPINNDESYYIAFSKHLQLSYVDAPPFVSYLSFLQTRLGFSSPLILRAFVILLHFISTLFLMAIVRNHSVGDRNLAEKLLITFLIAYVVPIFGLFGILILPDTGLILGLSIMLWAADGISTSLDFSWKNTFILGFGLGIGLLSKYHILPLGGGILLGILIEQWSWRNFGKLWLSGIIGLLCAAPLFIWNYENHWASFVFQLQHGFGSVDWQLSNFFLFLGGTLLYMTPWFAFVLIKDNLFGKRRAFVLIPFISLMIILLISSLRNNVLPHWMAPAFWLFIPYAVLYSHQKPSHLKSLMRMCLLTAVFWIFLLGILLMPGGLINIKKWSTRLYPDAIEFMDLFFWQEIPNLIQENPRLFQDLSAAIHNPQNSACAENTPIIGTFRWFWASQLEYRQIFPGAKILNLDQSSSSFYLWRDHWAKYAHCNILLIGREDQFFSKALPEIMTIHQQDVIKGLGDYRSLNLILISATFKDPETIENAQKKLLAHPHY